MLRAAIVEDNEAHAQALTTLLQAWSAQAGVEVQMDTFSDGYDISMRYTPNWDVLFLDIEMRLMDGMETARRIREADSRVIIIFITANPRYAIAGYQVQALDYLLKPVSPEAFGDTMRRCMRQLAQRMGEKTIQISRRDGVLRLSTAEILYVESQGHRLRFFTADGSEHETTATTLRVVEEELASSGFFRVSSGCLVNLKRVRGISGNEVLVGSHRVTLSRSRREALMQALTSSPA